MYLDINLRFNPSAAFIGVLAELNEQFSEWTDGSYDWAAQTTDFLHSYDPLPQFDEALFNTPLSQRAVNDLLQMAIAIYSGDYPSVRQYLQDVHFAFVIGFPRSGGSYLTKELLRTLGMDHKRVSETLAHDGFPELREVWFDRNGNRPYYHLQDAIFQVAEFLVISKLYFQKKNHAGPDGRWLIPKKMHKMVAWASSFKMLLGKGRADYLVTVRHPLPTAISIFEKCGGLPADGRFPMRQPRCAIERWIVTDLMLLGWTAEEVEAMDYVEAVGISWANFYLRMANSGLFLGLRDEIRVLSYGADRYEEVVREYQSQGDDPSREPEPFLIHEKASEHPEWQSRADAQVVAVRAAWSALGLTLPELSYQ